MKVLIALVGIAIAMYAFLALSKKPDRTLSKLDEALRFGTRLSETPRGSSSLIESNKVEVRVGGSNADVTEIHRLKYEVNRNGFMTIVVPDSYVDYLDSDRLASVLQENLYTMVTLPDGEILTRRAEPTRGFWHSRTNHYGPTINDLIISEYSITDAGPGHKAVSFDIHPFLGTLPYTVSLDEAKELIVSLMTPNGTGKLILGEFALGDSPGLLQRLYGRDGVLRQLPDLRVVRRDISESNKVFSRPVPKD